MRKHSCCYMIKLRKGLWSPDEDEMLLYHINRYGLGYWSSIPKQAAQLPGRTENEIRNFWNSNIKKKLKKRGIDPKTHKPIVKTECLENYAIYNSNKLNTISPGPMPPSKQLFASKFIPNDESLSSNLNLRTKLNFYLASNEEFDL